MKLMPHSSFFLIPSLAFLVGCLPKSDVNLKSSGGPTAESDKAAIRISQVQGKKLSQLVLDDQNFLHTNLRRVAINGECERGVSSVVVKWQGGPLGSHAPCSAMGKFSWSHELVVDGNYELEFKALLDNVESSKSVLQKIRLDTIPPAVPVITTNVGATYASPNANVLIDGTISRDTYSLVTGGVEIPVLIFSSTLQSFQLYFDLNPGETVNLSVHAKDQAGNLSAPTIMTVSYLAFRQMAFLEASGVGLDQEINGVNGSVTLEAATTLKTLAPIETSSVSGAHTLTVGTLAIADNHP